MVKTLVWMLKASVTCLLSRNLVGGLCVQLDVGHFLGYTALEPF